VVSMEQCCRIQTSTSEFLYFILHLQYIIRQVTSVGFRACIGNLFVRPLPGERISPATTVSLCPLSQTPAEDNLMWLASWLFSHLSMMGSCSHVLWYTNSRFPLAGRTRILVFGLSYLNLSKRHNHVSESSASIEYFVQPTSFGVIPVYKTRSFIPRSLTMTETLDEFKCFYINKFIDYCQGDCNSRSPSTERYGRLRNASRRS
jgi:hypothetical protein